MIFEVTSTHIEALSDTDLRTLIGYLCEREVVIAGHSASSVTYSGHQNAKDGGIDVRVALESGKIDGFVPRLDSGFQAKAEDFGPADIAKEMRPKGELRESIRALREAEGAYIIVSSKGSVSDTSLKNRRKAMADTLAGEPGGKTLVLDFYDKRRIATWVNQHPGIVPWVRSRVGQPISGWRPFQDWSSSPGADDAPYVLDDGVRLLCAGQNDGGLKAEDGIERLRSVLGQARGVVRLVGLSGVGKTRLVQALFDERIGASPLDRHLAVYTDMGDQPDPVPAELLGRLQSNGQRAILIVDNCGADLHRTLAARLTHNSRISLITVEYDIREDDPENTDVFKLEPASKEVIEKILKPRYPKLSGPEIQTIAEFSEGNFRIALALANTAKGGQSLANLKDPELFNRLFRQKHEDNPALLKAAKTCSLVYSFDAETIEGDEAELPVLTALAGQTPSEFHGHVAELKRRQLVQARAKWRALLPHALAHRLAKLALEDFLSGDINALIAAAPERLLKSFSRRLGCLHDCPPAQKIVGEWLASGGLVSNVGQLNTLEMVILDNVAPVNPEATLKSISAAAFAKNDFFEQNDNRERLIRLLRSLAYDPALFDEATDLIARFAQSKTESNNMGDAVNVLKSLFYLHLSGTHAPAKQRADFIRKLAASGSEADEELALTTLDAMLECGHYSSSYGFEFGTRKRNYGFNPSTWDEQFDWFAEAFALARDLAALPSMRTRVRTMLASQFRHLAPRMRLSDLIELADHFASDGGWPEGWAGVRGALREARKAKHEESIEKLVVLEAKLAPSTLAHRIASYVLPSQWGNLDLAEVDFDDEKRYEKTRQKIGEVCEALGAELANDMDALAQHLPELLASQSDRVSIVAKAIGRTTTDPVKAWRVIEEHSFAPEFTGTISTLPGNFLSGLAERDRGLVEQLLDEVSKQPNQLPFLAHMQLCVGIDERGSKRLVEAIPSPSLPTWTLRNLAGGRSTDDIAGAPLRELLAAVSEKDDDGFDVAMEILYMRLYSLRSDKKPITDDEHELAKSLLSGVMFDEKKSREPHMLAEIVEHALRAPEDSELARNICRNLLDAVAEYRVSAWDYSELVAELAAKFPRVVLDEGVERADTEGEGRRGLFGSFREHRPCPLRKVPVDILITWASEKPETRFVALAGAIVGWRGPKSRQNPDNASEDDEATGLKWTPEALRLIHEAPDPALVLQEFAERFRPSGWSGSLASIIAGREPLLEELASDEDQRIAGWAKAAIPKLRAEAEHWRKFEAEEDRERDERFEW